MVCLGVEGIRMVSSRGVVDLDLILEVEMIY